MSDTKEERRLSRGLREKIDSIDKARPYVWRLRLSEADFRELEACLTQSVAAHDGSCTHLLGKEWAMTVVVYLAEWYKRRYYSGETQSCITLTTDQLQQLWQAAGLNQQVLLYTDQGGNRRWLYSIYVLGGLAVRHEVNRPDSKRFLRALCRIYHGEDFSLESLDDAQRAAAFRESIRRQHALYAFMQELLNGQLPFAEEDRHSDDVRRFVDAMQAANKEVLRQKFRLEWHVPTYALRPEEERMLRLCLCPEEVGGGRHHYLRYERLTAWGIAHAGRVGSVRISLSYCNDEGELKAADWQRPLITYSNTGSSVNGFLSWGVERTVLLKHAPREAFTHVRVWLKADDGAPLCVQTIPLPVWHTEFDDIVLHRYNSLIAYAEGGTIRHRYEDEDGEDEEWLPLIFRRSDIESRHRVEWKQPNGIYTEWTEGSEPKHGLVRLRLSMGGYTRLLAVAYLPGLSDEQPLVRHFATQQIHYADINGQRQTTQDHIERNGTPLHPTYIIKVGKEGDTFELPVIRPTRHKEVCIDGKVAAYRDDEVILPYILKDEATLRDFSEEGFRSYDCKQITGLYDMIRQQPQMDRYAFCKQGYAVPAMHLDEAAPKCLLVALGAEEDAVPAGVQCYTWDYDRDCAPVPCDYATEPERNTIVFQSKRQLTDALTCLPTKRKFFAFNYNTVVAKKMTLRCCFEVAVRHRLYFYDLEPMTKQSDNPDVWRTEVYEPLLAQGPLSEQHLRGLQRLAEEMDFRWEDLGVNL